MATMKMPITVGSGGGIKFLDYDAAQRGSVASFDSVTYLVTKKPKCVIYVQGNGAESNSFSAYFWQDDTLLFCRDGQDASDKTSDMSTYMSVSDSSVTCNNLRGATCVYQLLIYY